MLIKKELGELFWSVLILVYLASVCQSRRMSSSVRDQLKKVNTPYVTLYANDFHRGEHYVETLLEGCKNLPDEYSNWASSINTHNRCVDVCASKNCEGKCARVYPSSGVNTDLSLKLNLVGMNDNIVSLKSCYTLMSRRWG